MIFCTSRPHSLLIVPSSVACTKGRLGVAIAKTKQAIVIGHHGETQVAGNTSATVEGLADYLINQGY